MTVKKEGGEATTEENHAANKNTKEKRNTVITPCSMDFLGVRIQCSSYMIDDVDINTGRR